MSFLSSLAKIAVPVVAAFATGGASAFASAAAGALGASGGVAGLAGAAAGALTGGGGIGGVAEAAAGVLGASPAVAKLAGTAVGALAGDGGKPQGDGGKPQGAHTPRAGQGANAAPAHPAGSMASCACGTDEDEADLEDDADCSEAGEASTRGAAAECSGPMAAPPCPLDLLGAVGQFIGGGGPLGAIARDAAERLHDALPHPCPQIAWKGTGW